MVTLAEHVYQLVEKEGTGGEGFENLVKIYGLERLRALYLDGKKSMQEKSKHDPRKKAAGDSEE